MDSRLVAVLLRALCRLDDARLLASPYFRRFCDWEWATGFVAGWSGEFGGYVVDTDEGTPGPFPPLFIFSLFLFFPQE